MNNLRFMDLQSGRSYCLSEINQMPEGNYSILINNQIKHHHEVIIPEQEDAIYYLVSFASSGYYHDDDIADAIEESVDHHGLYGFFQKVSVERHPSTFSKYVKNHKE